MKPRACICYHPITSKKEGKLKKGKMESILIPSSSLESFAELEKRLQQIYNSIQGHPFFI